MTLEIEKSEWPWGKSGAQLMAHLPKSLFTSDLWHLFILYSVLSENTIIVRNHNQRFRKILSFFQIVLIYCKAFNIIVNLHLMSSSLLHLILDLFSNFPIYNPLFGSLSLLIIILLFCTLLCICWH